MSNNQSLRRAPWMDYRDPSIMMMTLVTTNRQPLLGVLKGNTIERTALGQAIAEEIERIPTYKGAESIEIYSYMIMPDHVHILLRIHDRLPKHIGRYLYRFKVRCSQLRSAGDRRVLDSSEQTGQALSIQPSVSSLVPAGHPADKGIPPLFAPEYHDRILTHRGQLAHMVRYIQDNPRRLALKRANKDLFRIHQNYPIGSISSTVLGNIFLIEHPLRQVLQCSRRLTQEQIDQLKEDCLREAAEGTIFLTAAISEGEKQIARALREGGYPLIILLHEGFPAPDDPHYRYFKPQGVYFEACAAGKLLLIEPHPDLLERADIAAKTEAKVGHIPHDTQRYRFVAMNMLAEELCK